MNDSPDVQGHHGPTSRPGATDDTVAAETLAATPFPATEQIDQADATGPVDDMVPFSGADDAADLSGDREERWWRRLPLLAFAIAALAALVALASAGVVLTSTSRTDAPHDVQSVAGSRHDDAVCSADAVTTPASPSPTAPPMTTRYLRVPFVPVPIPVQVPSNPYQPPQYP